MTAQIQVRRDTTANWTATNPILRSGEFGYDISIKALKMGDGVTQWTSLPFITTDLTTSGATFQSYTPTLTQSSSVAKTVTYAKYMQVGKLVTGNVKVAATAAGTLANSITLSLPVTAATSGLIVGSGQYFDTGANEYRGPLYLASTTTVSLLAADALQTTNNVALGAAPSIAVASGDIFSISFQYEAA